MCVVGEGRPHRMIPSPSKQEPSVRHAAPLPSTPSNVRTTISSGLFEIGRGNKKAPSYFVTPGKHPCLPQLFVVPAILGSELTPQRS